MKRISARSLVASISSFCLASVALAGINAWTTAGPLPAAVYALAADPSSPSIVYSGLLTGATAMGHGVFRSADGGASWPLHTLADQFIRALATGPPGTVYAGSDTDVRASAGGAVFKSTDAGMSWSLIVPAVGPNGVDILRVDPATPTTLYRASSDRIVTLGSVQGFLYRSTDGGSSWAYIKDGLGFGPVRALALDTQNSGTLYAVTEAGFFRSTNFGSGWSVISNNGLVGRTVTALAVDPFSPTTIYAGTIEGVSKSTDGGATFTSSSVGLPNVFVTEVVCDPAHPLRLYAGTYGRGVFTSSNGGTSWTALNDGLTDLSVEPRRQEDKR